jgi:NADH-quinone oxidoreductase subunit J
MIEALAFYLFAGILILSALMVISARNPVHSVLFLILGFFNAAGLFVLLGAEFIAMILVIVYVGAVAVLFLFVVMMLDISFADLRKGAMQYVPVGLLIGGILLAELILLFTNADFAPAPAAVTGLANTQQIGSQLYTQYLAVFQISGLVLLVATAPAPGCASRKRPSSRSARRRTCWKCARLNPGRGPDVI